MEQFTGIIDPADLIVISRLLVAYSISLLGSFSRNFIESHNNEDVDMDGLLIIVSAIPSSFVGSVILDVMRDNIYVAMLFTYCFGILGVETIKQVRKIGVAGMLKYISRVMKAMKDVDIEDIIEDEEDADKDDDDDTTTEDSG